VTEVSPQPQPESVPSESTPDFSSPPSEAPIDKAVSWRASEFIAHEKSPGWYLLLALAAMVGAAAIYLLTKDKVSAGVVVLGALLFGVYAGRKPRELNYQLDGKGLTVGQKFLAYEEFRCFAIVAEGAFESIIFTPLRRFAPLTTIYFDPKDEEQIVGVLSKRLPLEEHTHDAVDRLMRRIRF
jgi:hypothetical protein